MSDEIEALKEAVRINREQVIEDLLISIGFTDMDHNRFEQLISILEEHELRQFKITRALESQQIIEHVLGSRN